MMIVGVTFVAGSGPLETEACMESLKKFVTVTWLKFQIPIGGEKVLAGKP